MSGHFLNDHRAVLTIRSTVLLASSIISKDSPPEQGGPKFSERFKFMPEYPTTDEGKVPLVGEEEVMGAVVSAFWYAHFYSGWR